MRLKLLAYLSVLLAAVVLQGCKHPLAIVGEGDIVEVGHSGRGCTLEQFRAGDRACADNEVTDDYFVNYKAVPRPGWRFVRWEGPCSPRSAFQHCRQDFNKATVEWWEANHPDTVIPASTAVFQPIEGETGYLLAGTPVAGVSYKTDTQQGVTGLDGSFQYEAGETVQFGIGATVLGNVTGKARVTPFDLAGSPVLTGIHITWALQDSNDPYHTLINLTVLLHSLDADGDPDNGIEIRAGVASLMTGIVLDLHRPWDGGEAEPRDFEQPYRPWLTFQTDPTFRHVLGRARRANRFSTPHRMADPAAALASLYNGLGIEPNIVGLSLLQVSQIGEPDQFETLDYDANGNISRHENTVYENAYELWQYTDQNKVAMHELQGPGGASPLIELWQYDDVGNLTRFETNERIDIRTYRYDDDENLTRASWTVNNGRETNVVHFSYNFDKFGRLRQVTASEDNEFERWRFSALGKVVRRDDDSGVSEAWIYAANGNLIRHEGGIFGIPETYEYDDAGRLIRSEQQDTWCDRGCYRLATIWERDSSGRVIARKLLNLEDNSVGETDVWQYDDSGRVISRTGDPLSGDNEVKETWEYYPNGMVERHTLRDGNAFLEDLYDTNGNLTQEVVNDDGTRTKSNWDYDVKGNLVNYDLDRGNTGSVEESTAYEYVTTGWAHLFSGIKVYGQPYLPPTKPVPAHEEPPPDNDCSYQGFFLEINNC